MTGGGVNRRRVLSAAGAGMAGLGFLTMTSNRASAATATDSEMEERIGHPLPETTVRMGEPTDEGAYVKVSVDDAHGWRYLNAFRLNDSVWSEGGPGQVSLDLTAGEYEGYLATSTTEEPARIPYGSIYALQAFYDGADGVYYSLLRVLPNNVWTFPASGVSDEFCWWTIGDRCLRSHARPILLDLPNGDRVFREVDDDAE